MMAGIIRRAALDVGSGSTKYCVADVNVLTNRIERFVRRGQYEVLVGHDLKKHGNGILSDSILEELETALSKIKKILEELDPPPASVVGVSTAAFRESKNGREWADSVHKKFGFPLRVISQKEEGLLGFESAVAESMMMEEKKQNINDIISFDVGGASFQLACTTSSSSSSSPSQELIEDDLEIYEGRWGASKATHAMVSTIQKKDFSVIQSPNPVAVDDPEALRQLLHKDLSTSGLPRVMASKIGTMGKEDSGVRLVAIGDKTSTFKIASLSLDNATTWTPDDLRSVIARFSGKTDEELSHLPQPEMVLPKLVLQLSIMEVFGLQRIYFASTVGSTSGMFVHPSLWK